jgi:hypothetical protein
MPLNYFFLGLLLIFYLFFILGAFSLLIQSVWEPPFAPTLNKQVPKFLAEILDQKPEISLFWEPGSGLANISRIIKRKYPKLEVYATEKNFFIFSLAWLWNLTLPKKTRINLIYGDALKSNLTNKNKPTLIYSYLLPDFVSKLHRAKKFKNSIVLSLDFQLDGVRAKETLQVGETKMQYKAYIYDFLDPIKG